MRRKIIITFAVLFTLVLGVSNYSAGATDYPTRAITLIVPYNPGGSTDPISRQYATQLEKILPGNVNVENRPGGAGSIGLGAVIRAKPDGYTLGLGTNSILGYQPLIHSGIAWKTTNDYQSIVKLMTLPNVLTVRADAPWKTFEELMADARKNPRKIRVGVPALRTGSDLDIQQFNKLEGVEFLTVPFTGGSGEASIALLGGRIEAQAGPGISNLGLVQAGKLRALAVFKEGKYKPFPEAGPAYKTGSDASMPSMYCVIAPKGMPRDVLDKLVTASLQLVRSEEWIKFAELRGSSEIDVKGPEMLKAELDQYTKRYDEVNKFIDKSGALAPKK